MYKQIEGQFLGTDDVGFIEGGVLEIKFAVVDIEIVVGVEDIDNSSTQLDFRLHEDEIVIG